MSAVTFQSICKYKKKTKKIPKTIIKTRRINISNNDQHLRTNRNGRLDQTKISCHLARFKVTIVKHTTKIRRKFFRKRINKKKSSTAEGEEEKYRPVPKQAKSSLQKKKQKNGS